MKCKEERYLFAWGFFVSFFVEIVGGLNLRNEGAE